MDIRVTQQTILHRALSGARSLTDQLASLQSQVATGKRLAKVSDDPTASVAILSHTAQGKRFMSYLDSIQATQTALNASVSALDEVNSIFIQAKSIAVEASNSVNDTSSFDALAQQVDAMIERLMTLANSQSRDTYLYSGTALQTAPFVVSRTDAQGRPLEVAYQGTADATVALADQRVQIPIFYAGADVFLSRDRQATVFAGATGARPGGGTDTAIGFDQLILTHTSTTYAAGSGVQPGTGTAGDTILGPAGAHRLTIVDTSGTGASGTIALDDGAVVNFTSGDTNLRLSNSKGDIVFVDTTAITPGFNGTVDITADGTMSIDGGATTTPLTFASDQAVVDSVTNRTTFVDTSGIERVGTEQVTYPGTFDAFQSLIALRDLLRNVDQRGTKEQIDAISAHLGELDRVRTHVLEVVGAQSASLQNLESLQSHLEDMKLAAERTVGELGDADLADLVVKLQSYENMLQLTLATYSRVINQSLLDFLQ